MTTPPTTWTDEDQKRSAYNHQHPRCEYCGIRKEEWDHGFHIRGWFCSNKCHDAELMRDPFRMQD